VKSNNAMSGENDLSKVIREEFLKEWGAEDDFLSSPTQEDEDENSDEADNIPEDDDLSDGDEDEAVETEADDAEGEPDESDDVPEAKYAEDTDKIKFKVNGEEHEVSVAEIKRLAGQERAIEHRAKDVVANERKVAELHDRAIAAGEEMYNRALARYTPWQNFDWAKALKDLPSESYNSLRAEAEDAYRDVTFHGETLDRVTAERRQQTEQVRARELQERSVNVVKELSDPVTGIKDFSEAKLAEIGKYALASGIPAENMPDVFHTPLLKMFEKARLYDLSQTVKTTPVVKTAKKIVKQKVNVETTRAASNGSSAKKANAELAAKGGREAAIKAMMADWSYD